MPGTRQNKKLIVWLIMVSLGCLRLTAQVPADIEPAATNPDPDPPALYTVGQIIVTGNDKTKETFILREIPFKTGEVYTLGQLVERMETGRKQLLNTTLFHTAVVAAKDFDGTKVNISIELKERWYLFPVPYFKPVDRNLNQWIVENNASLNRVNYGVKVMYNNVSGRNDRLRLLLLNGYTRQVSMSYDRLYIDRQMKWGMSLAANMGKNREVNYATLQNKQVFIKDNNYIRNFFDATAELTYRKAINTRHRFGAGYFIEDLSDTVTFLNPAYFKNGRNRIAFPELHYTMTHYNVDYIPYPTKGYAAWINLSKKGFTPAFNVWQLSVKGLGSWHLSPKTFFNVNLFGSIKLPFRQPYYNQRFLGYGDASMQGYEYYVVDGVAGGFAKTTLAREIFHFSIKTPASGKRKQAERIPFRVFAKAYGNAGYVYNPQPGDNSLLTNKMLYSGGVGIDILTVYDITFRIEYTFNQLGQNGVFLHRRPIF